MQKSIFPHLFSIMKGKTNNIKSILTTFKRKNNTQIFQEGD